jgi:hypothetical protein
MDKARAVIIVGFAGIVISGWTGTGAATANRGHDAETIRLRDDCHPATFNAAVRPGICVGDGDTTFEEFAEELANGGHDHWRNNPTKTEVRKGEGLHLENRGGEFHTFTKVARFSDGGCEPAINVPLGVPTRDRAFCDAAFADPDLAVPAKSESDVPASRLHRGHNRFQCMIHPWMTTVVEVESRR